MLWRPVRLLGGQRLGAIEPWRNPGAEINQRGRTLQLRRPSVAAGRQPRLASTHCPLLTPYFPLG